MHEYLLWSIFPKSNFDILFKYVITIKLEYKDFGIRQAGVTIVVPPIILRPCTIYIIFKSCFLLIFLDTSFREQKVWILIRSIFFFPLIML